MLGSLIGHHTSFLAFGMKAFQILPTWQLLGENIISPDRVIYPEFWMILEKFGTLENKSHIWENIPHISLKFGKYESFFYDIYHFKY